MGEIRDRYYEHLCDHNNSIQLYRSLPAKVQDKTIIRLHHGTNDRGFFDKDIWYDNFHNLNIDDGVHELKHLVNKSRLLVFNYDSSGVLEYLALNVPVICFWSNSFDHLLPSAKPYYQLLKDVGIYFEKAEDASEHISKHWGDIDGWWSSSSVQEARKKFCNRYSRVVNRPLRTLKKILLS